MRGHLQYRLAAFVGYRLFKLGRRLEDAGNNLWGRAARNAPR